jgi:hypothetical protein
LRIADCRRTFSKEGIQSAEVFRCALEEALKRVFTERRMVLAVMLRAHPLPDLLQQTTCDAVETSGVSAQKPFHPGYQVGLSITR